jgi:hypothetical protein
MLCESRSKVRKLTDLDMMFAVAQNDSKKLKSQQSIQ